MRVGVTVILGRNGAGKTTLLEGLSTLPPKIYGKVTVLGQPITNSKSRLTALASIGYIPQYDSLLPRFTVREFVEYCGWLKGVDRGKRGAMATRALQFAEMLPFADQRIGKLSGGTRQRASIAASLIHDPAVWILDEPTVGLDPEVRAMFRQNIAARAQTSAILLSTHLIEDVNELASRCIVLAEGRVLFDGTPDELAALDDGNHPAATGVERGYLTLSANNSAIT